jgi:hypothetical protein
MALSNEDRKKKTLVSSFSGHGAFLRPRTGAGSSKCLFVGSLLPAAVGSSGHINGACIPLAYSLHLLLVIGYVRTRFVAP